MRNLTLSRPNCPGDTREEDGGGHRGKRRGDPGVILSVVLKVIIQKMSERYKCLSPVWEGSHQGGEQGREVFTGIFSL